MIKIENLSVLFPNFSLEFNDVLFKTGHITFVTGKNGVGKSTFLKSIGKLIPYEGTITYKGFATYHSQEPLLFNRSVIDNIIYPLKIRKRAIKHYQEAINQYAEILDIDHLLNRPAKELSSGETMKVSLIRSIIFHPEIVLLDEPTTHLDLESIEQLKVLLKKLKSSITFIIVSHNKAFIDDLQDAIYHLGGNHVFS